MGVEGIQVLREGAAFVNGEGLGPRSTISRSQICSALGAFSRNSFLRASLNESKLINKATTNSKTKFGMDIDEVAGNDHNLWR